MIPMATYQIMYWHDIPIQVARAAKAGELARRYPSASRRRSTPPPWPPI